MRTLYTVFLLLAFCIAKGQDVHFSHIHASPTVMNPAMTGLFDGDVRIIGNYRSQWNNFTNGYKTVAGSVDTKMFPINRHDFIGAGIQVYQDVAGDLDFKTNYAGLSFSLLKAMDGRGTNFISFGLQGSFVSNSVDFSKIEALDNEPLIQNGAPDLVNYWDISAGIGWFYSFNRNTSINLGTSLAHINEPRVSFFDDGQGGSNVLRYRNWIVHGGADIILGRKSTLKPNFVFKDQGPHREIMVGSFWKYKNLRGRLKKPASLYFGGWLRWYWDKNLVGKDAFIFAIRFDLDKMFLTFSFDANISQLNRVSAGNGGPEFSVIKIFDFSPNGRRSSKVECPAFLY